MAISTFKTFLMYLNNTTWEKLCDIKSFPDLGGDPENLDATTLSDPARVYVPGIQNTPEGFDFEVNYDAALYQALKAMEGIDQKFAVWMGADVSGNVVTPKGYDGKYSFDGKLSVYVNGGGVNEVTNMTVTIAPSSIIASELRTTNPNTVHSVAGSSSNATFIVINNPAPVGTKWVYKLGTSDVTLTEGTAVAGFTNWVSSSTSISASSNTKACVALVFSADNMPIEYTNITLVKGA